MIAAPLGLSLLLLPAPCALQGTLGVDAGAEYDSNANRGDASLHAPLLRLRLLGGLRHAAGRHRLRLDLDAGGKLFLLPAAFDQTVGVVQLAAEEAAQFPRLKVGGYLAYYDSLQFTATDPLTSRDFQYLELGARLAGSRALAGVHALDGAVELNGQHFLYRPDEGQYSYGAPSLQGRVGARLHAGDPELGHDFDLALTLRGDYRIFYDAGHQDTFLQGGVSAGWTSSVVVQLGYTAQLNLNFSKPQFSYLRHLVLSKVSFHVPGDLYVTLKGQINLFRGEQPLPLMDIDGENRSMALLDLERPFSRGVALQARYAAYFNVTGAPYQRHTVYLGVSYRFQRQRP